MTEMISVHGLPFLACLAMLSILSYAGIHVLKREVIFIDIALAQIAAVGAIGAHVVLHMHEGSVYVHALSLGCTLVAAAFFAIVRRRIVEIPLEAVIGVSYAVSTAAALFLVGISPGGHVHVQEMLAGSILWATWNDVLWSAVIFAAVGFCFYLFRRPFRTISESYDEALATGYNTLGWDFLFYALLGVVITTAVSVAGVVVVFAFLIIPATLSALFSSGWTSRLAVACVAGAISVALGLLFADRFDFSVGPAVALFLGSTLIAVGLLRGARVPRTVTAAACLVAAVAIGGFLAAGVREPGEARAARAARAIEPGPVAAAKSGVARAELEVEPEPAAVEGHGMLAEEHSGHGAGAGAQGTPVSISDEELAAISDPARLEQLYGSATDAEERSAVVLRLLEVKPPAGAGLALEFLGRDPPLLFRMEVVEGLEQALGHKIGYDFEEPFDSPSNQQAVSDLRRSVGID